MPLTLGFELLNIFRFERIKAELSDGGSENGGDGSLYSHFPATII